MKKQGVPQSVKGEGTKVGQGGGESREGESWGETKRDLRVWRGRGQRWVREGGDIIIVVCWFEVEDLLFVY